MYTKWRRQIRQSVSRTFSVRCGQCMILLPFGVLFFFEFHKLLYEVRCNISVFPFIALLHEHVEVEVEAW